MAKAKEAVPGEACKARAKRHGRAPGHVVLTTEQRQYLRNHVAKEHWLQLSKEQQTAYMDGQPVLENPFFARTGPQLPPIL